MAAHQSSHHGRRSWGNQPFAYGFVRVWLVAEMVGLLVVGFLSDRREVPAGRRPAPRYASAMNSSSLILSNEYSRLSSCRKIERRMGAHFPP